MDIIRNIKDVILLRSVVQQHIDKYLQTDVENRDLMLQVFSTKDGITVVDLDDCDSGCPFYDAQQEEFEESGYNRGYEAADEDNYSKISDLEDRVTELKDQIEDLKADYDDQIKNLEDEIEALEKD